MLKKSWWLLEKYNLKIKIKNPLCISVQHKSSTVLILNKVYFTSCIDQILCVYPWYTAPSKTFPWETNTPSLLPNNKFHKDLKENGPDEGTTAVFLLELISSFVYYTHLVAMMYAHVTYCPDTGYVITTITKFFTMPSALHCYYLKHISKYRCLTITQD